MKQSARMKLDPERMPAAPAKSGIWLVAGAGAGAAVVLAMLAYLMGLRAGGPTPRLLPDAPRVAQEARPEPLTHVSTERPAQPATRSLLPAAPEELIEPEPSEEAEPEMSALEHQTKVIAELRASGPAEHLASPAAAVVAGWSQKLMDFGVETTFEAYECYAKGCFTTAQHANGDAATKAAEVIVRTGEFNGWQAGKMRTGDVINGDGKVEVTWVLFPPGKDSPALPEELPPDTLDELRAAWAPTNGNGG